MLVDRGGPIDVLGSDNPLTYSDPCFLHIELSTV